MIPLHRLNKHAVVVNAAHIVFLEATPDTVITLAGGEKIMVRESVEEVIEEAVKYYRRIGAASLFCAPKPGSAT